MSKLDFLSAEYAKQHGGGKDVEEAFKAGYLRCTEAWVKQER